MIRQHSACFRDWQQSPLLPLKQLLFSVVQRRWLPWGAVRVAHGNGPFPPAETRIPSDSTSGGDERQDKDEGVE